MPTIEELMTRDVTTLAPEMTLREAVEVLSGADVSGAPVITDERVVGVVSRTDILDFQSVTPGVPVQRKDQAEGGEWGPADLWEEESEDVPSAWFAELWDDSGADVYERMNRPEGPEWDLLEEHAVSEVMTRQVIALAPDVDVRDAARLMADRGIHRILVTRNDRLAGILTSTDIVRAVAEGRI